MGGESVEDVRYPGRRGDVVEALDLVRQLGPRNPVRGGALDDAIHWLVDDTFWDMRDPAEDIGYRLRDDEEVTAIKAVLEPLLVVLDQLGPVRPDAEYLGHPRWPDVVATATAAHRLLVANDARAR